PLVTTEGAAGTFNTPQEPTRPVNEPTGATQPQATGFRTLTSPSSRPTGKSIELDLSDATLGQHATAPPNGNASFSLNITKPLDIAPGELVRLIASIRVEEVGAPSPQVGLLLRRDLTGSTLQMIMDQKTIYDKELETTAGKFKEVESEKTMSSDNPKLEIIQESGAKPVDVTIRGIRLAEAK
ncbi:hypothetical protein BGZ61DRAFT_297531, partial [Ilyonectria robusta]|uniref:uncharacterized protein n=1 Tax=Ilyonectria robusta TaxID=1079257 RepID=UPI001E8E7F36